MLPHIFLFVLPVYAFLPAASPTIMTYRLTATRARGYWTSYSQLSQCLLALSRLMPLFLVLFFMMTLTTHGPDLRLLLLAPEPCLSFVYFASESFCSCFLDSCAGTLEAQIVNCVPRPRLGFKPVHSLFLPIYPRLSAYIICHEHSIDLTSIC